MVQRVHHDSNMTIIDVDLTPELLAAIPLMKDRAIRAAAGEMEEAVREVFLRESNWPPNAPETIARKGSDKVMEESGFLLGALDIRVASADTPQLPGRNQRLVGWFDEPHPAADGRMTAAEIAMLHEMGLAWGENLEGHGSGGSHPEFAPPAGGKSLAPLDIPPRPWLSQAADTRGDDALEVGILLLAQSIMRFTMPVPPPSTGAVLHGAAAEAAGGSAFRAVFGVD